MFDAYWVGPPLKMAEPATSVSAPAAATRLAVSGVIPPSPQYVCHGSDHRLQFRDLLHGRGDEGLTAEAWIDRHDQHQIDEIKNILDARHRGRRIENGASFFTKRTDRLQ